MLKAAHHCISQGVFLAAFSTGAVEETTLNGSSWKMIGDMGFREG